MQTRKHYTKQFKLEAVRLLEQTDKPATEVARGRVRGVYHRILQDDGSR